MKKYSVQLTYLKVEGLETLVAALYGRFEDTVRNHL